MPITGTVLQSPRVSATIDLTVHRQSPFFLDAISQYQGLTGAASGD